MRSRAAWFIPLLTAGVLTSLFWWPLLTGGGFIGGDIYTYYLPQKTFYADRLAAGELPLWNNLVGHGYPLVAESQTGAFYPPYYALYQLFDVNTAYNLNHLLHYVLAFACAFLYARRLALTMPGALFAALVYTFAWFPPRACLEWAVVGGAWLPLALWCVESYLQTARSGNRPAAAGGYLLAASLVLALQMLAGHYNLAFITQLCLLAYVPLRHWLTGPSQPSAKVGRELIAVAVVLGAGFLLAAVQLGPTWELRQRSQRADDSRQFDPGYGHIPPLYWSQIVAPWLWYAPDIDTDRALSNLTALSIDASTNKVEAHLYFGMVPLALLLAGLARRRLGLAPLDPRLKIWLVLGAAALLYTSGWLLPVTRHLPGFSFFMGPGRYGIVTTLAAALLAGAVLDQLTALVRPRWRMALLTTAFVLTTSDLWLVSRLVTYAVMLEHPPIEARDESIVRRLLIQAAEQRGQPQRLFAPGPNLATLTGASATPPYLGLGPAEYFDPQLTMPTPDESTGQTTVSRKQVQWLQRAGITHVLSFEPLDPVLWPATLVWQGFDPLLSPAWARFQEPLYLYELHGSRSRASFVTGDGGTVQVVQYGANRVVIEAESNHGGRLVLTDLFYPGWTVAVDKQPADAIRFEDMYRAVDVPAGRRRIVWTYHPRSVYWGAGVSLVAILALAGISAVICRRPRTASELKEPSR